MKTKLIATLMLAGSSLFAGPRVFFGAGVGVPIAPAPVVVAPAPVVRLWIWICRARARRGRRLRLLRTPGLERRLLQRAGLRRTVWLPRIPSITS